MSVRVMTMVWDAPFPTTSYKLIALKLADCANDDGENVYPSVPRVERETGCSERTVRSVIADFEACGLLSVLTRKLGNRRGHSTVVRAFALELLADLAAGRVRWEQQEVEATDGDGQARIDFDTGQPKARKVWRLSAVSTPATTAGVQPQQGGTPATTTGVPRQPQQGYPCNHCTPLYRRTVIRTVRRKHHPPYPPGGGLGSGVGRCNSK